VIEGRRGKAAAFSFWLFWVNMDLLLRVRMEVCLPSSREHFSFAIEGSFLSFLDLVFYLLRLGYLLRFSFGLWILKDIFLCI
jgi:hypothetical protein